MVMFRIPSKLGQQGAPVASTLTLSNPSASNMHWPAGPLLLASASFDPIQIFSDIGNASWSAVKRALLAVFGGPTFSVGAVYGAGENLVLSVVDLLNLMKTLALADLADGVFQNERATPWYVKLARLAQPMAIAKAIAGLAARKFFEQQLRDAQQDRDALIASMRYAITHPGEVLGGIGKAYLDKWQRFEALIVKEDLSSKFEAGRIFGEVMIEVIGLLAAGAGLAKLAAKVPGFARIAARLGKIGNSLKTKIGVKTPGEGSKKPGSNRGSKATAGLTRAEKIEKIKGEIGENIKQHPLRQAYENEVAALSKKAEKLKAAGVSEESIAKQLHQARRDIGEKYKNVTPAPLRDYIYDVNTTRYGDKLGPSFDSLVEKAVNAGSSRSEAFQKIAQSASRPNPDVNSLLGKFGDWLGAKPDNYLDNALKTLGGG
jgi:hypothetical protein